MWEKPDAPPELPCIAVDFFEAGAIAARHLLGLGHQCFAALVGSKKSGIHAERYRGFASACKEAGHPHPTQRTRYINDTVESGYRATMELLREHPQVTAIFASNDLPALGAMNAIADMGMNVPRDVSVTGITDIQWARVSRPALTTVAVPTEAAARMSIELLLALIERRSPSPVMHVTAAPQLVERASTAVPRKR